jgi:hypothetical protein
MSFLQRWITMCGFVGLTVCAVLGLVNFGMLVVRGGGSWVALIVLITIIGGLCASLLEEEAV